MKKLCLIKTNKIVPELYGMSGPFYNPVELDTDQIISMMNRGVKVYEVNPENHKEMILLNRFLVNRINFVSKSKEEKKTVVASIQNHSHKNNKHGRKDKETTAIKLADFA